MDGYRPAGLEALLASSPSLRKILKGAERAALSAAPILILGEPGCGRSALARALHGASRRAGGPLVEVDPGLLPTELLESELFGYQRGAFTGAEVAMDGRVARAEGGTLVLDRIEALPIESQPKLLRLLAELRYAPLGGRERSADVRFIAIGPDDLERRVARGLFREDLFYRLEVLAFTLPAVRHRREDLPHLCEHFIVDLARRFGRSRLPQLTPRAQDWIAEHDWPGNLRELRNRLERAMIEDDGHHLDPSPPARTGDVGEAPASLAVVEKAQIVRALAHTRGHQGRAAELLGISRKALWQKRKRYGIP